jgi:drug/metabolite transporter (DMT)-like permease
LLLYEENHNVLFAKRKEVSTKLSKTQATAFGVIAILMWAILALLTAGTGQVPPFQLVAMSFAIAFLLAVGKWLWRRENPLIYLRLPAKVWIFGISGLFGYHLFYFLALRNAPVIEASLIAYLWPLLIVLFSALLPNETLKWQHIAGALIGFAGAYLLVAKGAMPSLDPAYAIGYLAAAACALIWSGYSVISRRFATLPTDTVGGFCGVTAVLAVIAHSIFEDTVWPANIGQWFSAIGLGLGPVGAAFFFWDIAVKRGHIQVLGALSYLAPLFSSLALIAAGLAVGSWQILVACLLITGGAVVASFDVMFKRRSGGRDGNGGSTSTIE